MFGDRRRIDSRPAFQSGAPHQRTTGRLKRNWASLAGSPSSQCEWASPGTMCAIAKTKSGIVKTNPTAKRRVKSCKSGSGVSSAKSGFRSSGMPHFGQLPGESLTTPGHIGQKNFAEEAGEIFSAPWQQGLFFKGGSKFRWRRGGGVGRGQIPRFCHRESRR